MSWNPDLYLGSEDHRFRLRPCQDLIDRIPLARAGRIVDLGCGAGNVTTLIAERWPEADVLGIDNDPAMLDRALKDHPRFAWQLADLASWTPERNFDLFISTAALQWVGEHERLLRRWIGFLTPGAVLALQMPRNFAAPSHTVVRKVVEAGAWRERLSPLLRRDPVASPLTYYRMLAARTRHVDVWETEYLHLLTGEDPVLTWIRSTGLRPFLEALDEPERSAFENECRLRLRRAYPTEPSGVTPFPFRRIFIVAQR